MIFKMPEFWNIAFRIKYLAEKTRRKGPEGEKRGENWKGAGSTFWKRTPPETSSFLNITFLTNQVLTIFPRNFPCKIKHLPTPIFGTRNNFGTSPYISSTYPIFRSFRPYFFRTSPAKSSTCPIFSPVWNKPIRISYLQKWNKPI